MKYRCFSFNIQEVTISSKGKIISFSCNAVITVMKIIKIENYGI